MTDEAILADADQFADEGMGLDAGTSPDANPFLDFHEGSDEGILTELAFIEVHRLNDRHSVAKLHIANFRLVLFCGLVLHEKVSICCIESFSG